ncbi:MAG: head-tail connector protein [Phyllobacterium sp.]
MTMHCTTPPVAEPVTLAEVRAHMRLGTTSEDELLNGLIKAARQTLEAEIGMAMISQTWRLHVDAWPRDGRVLIPKFPVRNVVTVTAYRPDGEPVTIPASDLRLDPSSRPAQLYLSPRCAGMAGLHGLEIDFRAGFGDTGTEVPDALKHAILSLIAHWYEFRGAVGPESQPASFPPGFDRLVSIWRRVSL